MRPLETLLLFDPWNILDHGHLPLLRDVHGDGPVSLVVMHHLVRCGHNLLSCSRILLLTLAHRLVNMQLQDLLLPPLLVVRQWRAAL